MHGRGRREENDRCGGENSGEPAPEGGAPRALSLQASGDVRHSPATPRTTSSPHLPRPPPEEKACTEEPARARIHIEGSLENPFPPSHVRHRTKIVIVTGQGAYEAPDESRRLSEILHRKGIPHVLDLWGHDVNHDWPWWREMLPYHADRLY